MLLTKLFLYGLQIKSFNGGKLSNTVILGDEKSMATAFGELNVALSPPSGAFPTFPFPPPPSTFELISDSKSSVKKILSGMKKGGRRRVLLPSSLAFGERGFPPYIAPNAAVVLEVVMTRKNIL